MEIRVSDDRPPIVPIVGVGLFAGVVAVVASSALAAGVGESTLTTLVGLGFGLLVGLLVKGRAVAAYEDRRGGEEEPQPTEDDLEPSP